MLCEFVKRISCQKGQAQSRGGTHLEIKSIHSLLFDDLLKIPTSVLCCFASRDLCPCDFLLTLDWSLSLMLEWSERPWAMHSNV